MDDEITKEIPVVRPAPPAGGRRAKGTPRWLVRAIATGAVLAVLLGAVDLALLVSRHPASSAGGGGPVTPATSPGPTTTRLPATAVPPPTSTGASSTTTTVTTTTVPAAHGDRPLLLSISPAGGGPGSVVAVRGLHFYSPRSGQVLARVDGEPTQTSCPTQSSCEVTVPRLPGGPRTAVVTVTTDAGTSNPLAFRYT